MKVAVHLSTRAAEAELSEFSGLAFNVWNSTTTSRRVSYAGSYGLTLTATTFGNTLDTVSKVLKNE